MAKSATQPVTPIRPTNRLRELRESAGESRVELALALGFKSDAQVQRWERGENIPTWHARFLAKRYGVTIGWLLKDPREKKAA